MARAPNVEDVPEAGLRQTADVVPIPQSASLQAATRVADATRTVIEEIADQQNEIALAQADTEAARGLDGILERYRTDDDWQTQPERGRVEATALLGGYAANLRGERTQRAWVLRTAQRLESFDRAVATQSRERGAELARADLVRLHTQSLEIAGDLSLPEEQRRLATTNYAGALARAQERGLVGEDWAAAREVEFAEAVRGQVREGLRGEFTDRITMDPDELADELDDPEGPWMEIDPAERARMRRQALQSAASMTMDDILEETLRTGVIVGDDDPRLADRWQYLGDGARLQYAERASNAVRIHQRAAALGELSTLSLPEIVARADEAGEDSPIGWGGRQLVRGMMNDPAAYVQSTQPNIELLRTRAVEAVRAAQQNPENRDLALAAVTARQQYAYGQVEAQASLGLSSGQIRITPRAQLEDWVRRVRRQSPDDQQRTLDGLADQLYAMYGDEDLAERTLAEHMEAYYAMPRGATASAPDPATAAAQGAEYGEVREHILRALRNGADLDDPRLDVLSSRLSPADRRRLMQDPDIAAAGGAQ